MEYPSQCVNLSQNLPSGNTFKFQYEAWSFYCLIALYLALFGGPAIYIFANRNSVNFKTRSPLLIILGYLFMIGDSVFNTLLYASPNEEIKWGYQCDMGILISVTVFNGILGVYFLRMFRVYKVFKCYGTYLRVQRTEAEQNFIRDSRAADIGEFVSRDSVHTELITSPSQVEQSFRRETLMESRVSEFEKEKQQEECYLRAMANLTEEALIWQGFKYYMVPFGIAGTLGCFFPYVFAFVPSHGNEICICAFYQRAIEYNAWYAIMRSDASYYIL